jgi:uracil-DNA glycosylase
MDLFSNEPDLLSLPYEEVKEFAEKCTKCPLSKGRTKVVFGNGPVPCDLMLIGEAPGADEDAQGLPFVGRAGQLLTKILPTAEQSGSSRLRAGCLSTVSPGTDQIRQAKNYFISRRACGKSNLKYK